ncbi:hypothetical protein B0H17DRAFT_1207483 [Mycena rosella]|uniref:Uncharacterized protein n=1 Tax=Mycena rosella TaxID=1033263 RepID=A0AAD7D2T1_MYCRO|nr:hypothetical protein B0H17DRAFT_1207483 [Mycena rosella]
MFISISRILLISSALAVGLATPTKRTATQIQADLKVFGTQLTALDSACKALGPDSTTAQVLAIAPKAGAVSASLKEGLGTVTSTDQLSAPECLAIYGILNSFAPTITDSLGQLIAKKLVFAKTPGATTLVSLTLREYQPDTNNYINALIKKCPSVATQLQGNEADLAKAFAAALAAYA